MTRKQFGIIFTLMALIVCVGVLSMKLNENGLTDPTDLSSVLSQQQEDNTAEETMSTQEYFYSLRLEKEQSDQKYVQDMKAISDNTDASQEQKDIANNALIQKTTQKDQEGKVELDIKNKGYEDALCMISESNVKVYVKVKESLPASEAALIKQTVEDITSLTNISIEALK